ncbi:hypothetical protein HPB51_001126 [Rhipicephalus microplus]|uniref:C2H2-type domain-containing protein n=1 Tax=Rhipicephalus microplus TaxID=6941 RepID=A0A9J6EVV4_RHIMP|nr:hypothetical protein HPB51_001126 [Rhipicephalus microplus]
MRPHDDQRPQTASEFDYVDSLEETAQARGFQGSREKHKEKDPLEVQTQVVYPPAPAPGVLETAVAHSHADHAPQGSVWDGGAGTFVVPAPPVRNAAVVCGPAGGNRGVSVRHSTGARPKDRRPLPPGLLSDSDSDNEEVVPASCGEATGDNPQKPSNAVSGSSYNTSVGRSSAGTQSNESSSQAKPTHHVCPECNRAFSTLIGLSQHRRRDHMEEYNADIDVQRVKPRWHSEEEYRMAVYEVQLRQEKVYNLNQRLHQKFPFRSFDAIKSHRRDANYRKLVEDLLRNQNRDPAERGNGNQDEQSGNVDVQDPNPANKRAETCEEIRKLTFKPPPKFLPDVSSLGNSETLLNP